MINKPYKLNGERLSHEEYKKLKYEDLRVRVHKGKKEQIKAFAETQGESLNSFVNKAIEEKMQRDKE